jgi:hypothetical protein
MIINNYPSSRIPQAPRYHFKSRGAPLFYDETNTKTHLRNIEGRKSEFLIERKNREMHLFEKRVIRLIEQDKRGDQIAIERGTERYLKLLNTY